MTMKEKSPWDTPGGSTANGSVAARACSPESTSRTIAARQSSVRDSAHEFHIPAAQFSVSKYQLIPQTGTVAARIAANGSPLRSAWVSAAGIENRAARNRIAEDIRHRSQAAVARDVQLRVDKRRSRMCQCQTRRSIQRVGPRHTRYAGLITNNPKITAISMLTTGFDNNGDGLLNDRPAGVGLWSLRSSPTWTGSLRLTYSLLGIQGPGGPGQRYKLSIYTAINNLTNHANLMGFSGVVTSPFFMADGSVVRAAADENPDLFWAIRGGGGNFGIAASLEYQLHPVGPMIAGGLVAHPAQKARDVFRFFRETCATLPDEMMMAAGLVTAPDGSGAKLAAMLAAHCGPLPQGEAALKPIKAFGPPVMDAMGPISYCAQNGLLDPSLPKGALNYWKAHFLTDLSDGAIDAMVEAFSQCESPMSQIVIEHFHGAASRVPVQDTACALRVTGFNVVIISQWMDPKENDRHIAWGRNTYKALGPYLGSARYVNYLDVDEEGDPSAVAYGANYARLRELKSKYDPENLFHVNVNIRPRGK